MFDPAFFSEASGSGSRSQHNDHDNQDSGMRSTHAGNARKAKRILSVRNLVVPKVPNAFQEDRCHFKDLFPPRLRHFQLWVLGNLFVQRG